MDQRGFVPGQMAEILSGLVGPWANKEKIGQFVELADRLLRTPFCDVDVKIARRLEQFNQGLRQVGFGRRNLETEEYRPLLKYLPSDCWTRRKLFAGVRNKIGSVWRYLVALLLGALLAGAVLYFLGWGPPPAPESAHVPPPVPPPGVMVVGGDITKEKALEEKLQEAQQQIQKLNTWGDQVEDRQQQLNAVLGLLFRAARSDDSQERARLLKQVQAAVDAANAPVKKN